MSIAPTSLVPASPASGVRLRRAARVLDEHAARELDRLLAAVAEGLASGLLVKGVEVVRGKRARVALRLRRTVDTLERAGLLPPNAIYALHRYEALLTESTAPSIAWRPRPTREPGVYMFAMERVRARLAARAAVEPLWP